MFLKGLVMVGAMGEKPILDFWNVGDWIVGRVFRMVSKEKNCVGSFFERCTRLTSKKKWSFLWRDISWSEKGLSMGVKDMCSANEIHVSGFQICWVNLNFQMCQRGSVERCGYYGVCEDFCLCKWYSFGLKSRWWRRNFERKKMGVEKWVF